MATDFLGVESRSAVSAVISGLKALVALMVSLVMFGLSPASAQTPGVCSGTISASPLRPLVKPLVVSLEHPIDAVANPELAEAFLRGVQSGGAAIAPKGQGTTTLNISFSMQSSGGKKGTYQNLNWLRSERAPGHIRSVLNSSHVDVTIYARDASSRALTWTGSISCTIQTDDVTALAEGLGAIVGRSLGQSLPKTAL